MAERSHRRVDAAHISVTYLIIGIFIRFDLVISQDRFNGGEVIGDLHLTSWDSPFYITEDIIVTEDSELTIEPGVKLIFSPKVMLAVNGTLTAKGNPANPILMTSDIGQADEEPNWPEDIRLVDDRSVMYGRLQVLYNGKWRGVCANAINWTEADTTVACRQLGFDHGNFSFFSWATNDSLFMLYHKPGCNGDEQSVLDCPGASNIKIGSRICKHQQTIHLHCYGLSPASPAHNYWWGLEFYNSSITLVRDTENLVKINESSSVLSNVIIEYSGVDPTGQPVPAVRASPFAPHLINVTLRHCALDAVNFTEVLTSTLISNSLITNNRGHGAAIETHLGRVSVLDSSITNNRGNGLKTKFLNGKFLVLNEDQTFCKRGSNNVGNPDYLPILITAIPIRSLPNTYCDTKFETKKGHRVTLTILEMDIEPLADGWVNVYDHYEPNPNSLIASYKIINGTLPQGVTSTLEYMYVTFNWTSPPGYPIGDCVTLKDCVKVTLLVDTAEFSKEEFFVNNTVISNNTQHGMFVENVRNFIHVNASEITDNKYGAGFRVFGGAGDIHVNASRLEHNQDNGVNITYDGGWRIFNMSSFSYNLGNGLNVTLNETSVDNKTRYAKHQRTEVSRSIFEFNDGYGMRVSNSCRPGKVVVNDSVFIQNSWDGIEVESCFRLVPESNVTNFTLANNTFDGNYGHGVRVNPMINMIGIMTNNTFRNHPRHTFLIDNTDDFLKEIAYREMKVDYQVIENDFTANEGFYVVHVRLTQNSSEQKLDFKYNRITGNRIRGGFPTINERTRAYGVVVLSSSNVNFSRNHLQNPESRYELTTHLLDQSAHMEATRLWWGTTNYTLMSDRVFDQYNRYDLPQIKYYPSLNSDYLYGEWLNDQVPPYEPTFLRPNKTIGGRLTEKFTTEPGETYHVDRDINIVAEAAEGKLHLSKGTVLEIENSIGILVQGQLMTLGTEEMPVVFKLSNESTFTNSTLIRLVDGPNEFEGRLEILPEGSEEWGTVCKEGWNIESASVACQMMGWVVYPDDWGYYEVTTGESWQPIWRSDVQCTELDMDLTRCKADGPADHSCNHTQDVYLRCKKPTWGGIHFVSNAQPSQLSHVAISECGLKDPTLFLYAPAIRIDYNTHRMEYLQVTDNVHDGIEIMKNDIYTNAALRHSLVANNQGNGVSIRGSFFELYNCTLSNNMKAGFEYNPHYTTYEARQLRFGIHGAINFDQPEMTLELGNEERKFVITGVFVTESVGRYIMEISVNSQYRVVMDIIDYTPQIKNENVTVYDGRKESIDNPGTRFWKIEDDLPDFPIESQFQYLTVVWDFRISSGRFAFVVRSKPYSWRWPFAELHVRNITTKNNEHGIVTRHYNEPSNEFHDLFFRYRWETIQMYGIEFINNTYEALHVPSITKYHELYLPTFEQLQNPFKICEITYEVESCYFTENGGGVLAEHNHVEFSNNVWIWQVTNNRFEYNRAGGFSIELPLVDLMSSELYNHSVDINDTIFEGNQNFEFRIDGFYCNSSIARNRFQSNLCKIGCVTISGTEKDFEMHDNEFLENVGKYIFEINMHSHTPYTRWVDAQIMYNNFKRNRKPDQEIGGEVSSSPTTYTMGIKGLQNITINRNLFDNYLDFELVGGYSSSSLENYLDVTQNWWGTTDQVQIQAEIFDFDDWNSYAIAEYYPHLVGNYFDAPQSSEGKLIPEFDPTQPLGGRITGNLRLPTRTEPYVVNRDLTIMPTGSIIIEKGVELQFYPNIGILVLGSMSALGTEDQRIKFTPIKKSEYLKNDTRITKRAVSVDEQLHTNPVGVTELPLNVRLSGGDNPDEGFIEIYNETERRWALLCDSNFNERTAEVACKTMGKESSNAIVRRSSLYDYYVFGYPKMHEQLIEWFWRETFICDGTEPSLQKCRYKVNYNLYTCMQAREYVFMRCGPRNLASDYEYWGNLRFSTAEFEDGDILPGFSILDHVDIYGAGILHGEKNAAIQAVHRSPSTKYVRITHSNQNGYDFVAPKGEFEVLRNEISTNNGYGFGGLVLNGDSNYENTQASFYPLVESTIPYNVFGLVRMCSSEKLIHVRSRLLLYYKYDFQSIDCLKIIRSREPNRRIAFRLLQFNMYSDKFYENALELYNGEYVSSDMMIAKLNASTNDDLVAKRRHYETLPGYDTMAIRITASAAYGDHGFIADIVTLPYSGGSLPNFGPGLKQRIANSLINHNEGGAFHFTNVGEDNPAVIIEQNRIQWNGLRLLNLTSGHVINMFIQNAKLATIANNYIVDNAGGLQINSTTTSSSNSVYFNITNNIINYNTHGESLHVEGHHFNKFEVQNNYLAFNDVGHRSVVSMFGVRLNYTTNIIFNNTGQCILNASVPEQIDINQMYQRNSFYDNQAYAANRSTVFLKSAKFLFRDNFFQNPYNIFEMVTFNRTKYPDGTYPEVKAEYNWWGAGTDAFVAGRVWDRKDDDNLIGVTYLPPHQTNQSVIEGRCYPGWRLLSEKCYLYFGGVISYKEAELECKANRARLGWARDKNYERMFGDIVSSMQVNYNEFWKTWTYSEWQREGKCTVLQNYQIEHIDCDENLPFICERDPYINPTIYWWPIQVALGCTGATLFVALIFVVFGFLKARQRKYERLQRRTEIRKSVHGSKASVYSNRGARSVMTGDSYSYSKKHRPPLSASADFVNLSGVTLDDSTDLMENAKLDFHRPSTPHTVLDYSSSRLDQSSYFDSDLGPGPSHPDYYNAPRLENEIRSVQPRRFEPLDRAVYYRNDAYDDDQSIDMARARSVSSMASPARRRMPYDFPSSSYSHSPSLHSQSMAHSEGNLARNIREKPPRPQPKESAM